MEQGLQKATIVGNSIENIETKDGTKPGVVLRVMVGEGEAAEQAKITIWLTEKALGIARRHLKTCGFDPDKEDFGVLIDKPQRLAGKVVDVIVEQKGQYMNVSLPLGNAPPSRDDVKKIGEGLRNVKKSHDEPVAAEAPSVSPPLSDLPCEKHGTACAMDCQDRLPF